MRRGIPFDSILVFVSCIVMLAGLVSCEDPKSQTAPSRGASPSGEPQAAESAVLNVIASNAPLAYFAAQIGGETVKVAMVAPADVDPAFWTPATADIITLQAADLILLNGAGFEPWRARVSLPERNVVVTADSFRSTWIVEDGVTHSHGLQGSHSHGETAFTTWINPMSAIEQARAIKDALVKARPAHATDMESRFGAVERDLRDLDGRLEAAIGGQQALPIIFSHPVYQYLQQRFSLNAISVHWEPEEMPSADALKDLETALTEHPARWMIWEDEPGNAIRAKLRELGIESIVFAPAGNMGSDWSKWLERQYENAAELAKVYQ